MAILVLEAQCLAHLGRKGSWLHLGEVRALTSLTVQRLTHLGVGVELAVSIQGWAIGLSSMLMATMSSTSKEGRYHCS